MIYACKFKGKRYDTGDRLGYVKAIVDFALKNENLKEDIIEYLRGILAVEKKD
jgi:UTP--glucose-1-phosphate uridylyltransferase